MIRMEAACFLVMVLIYLFMDGVTVYNVNHLDTVPIVLNNAVHRIFMGSMAFVLYRK